MWFTNDAFHFAWKKVSGDFALSAAVEWLGSGGNAHRKACLLANHGLLAGEATLSRALALAVEVETLCDFLHRLVADAIDGHDILKALG